MWYNHGLCLIQSLHEQGVFLGLRLGLENYQRTVFILGWVHPVSP